MFDNPGDRIKGVAIVFAVIGIIASVLLGFSLISNALSNDISSLLIMGVLVIILGAFASWFFSLLLYGFGELIENTTPPWKKFGTEFSGEYGNN